MRILNQQFEDSLRSQRYPFAGTGPLLTSSGEVLPDDLFLDLNLMVQAEVETVNLVSIVVAGTVATLRFELPDGSLAGQLVLDVATTALAAITMGTLTVGYARLDLTAAQIVRGWVPGSYTFTGISVIPHLLVVSDPAWRSGFRLPDGTILTGDVYLVADRGLRLAHTSDGFAVHVTGDPFNGRTVSSRGLLTLNSVAPDSDGNVNLIGLSDTNLVGSVLSLPGSPFRLNITPGSGSLTIGLTGSGT